MPTRVLKFQNAFSMAFETSLRSDAYASLLQCNVEEILSALGIVK